MWKFLILHYQDIELKEGQIRWNAEKAALETQIKGYRTKANDLENMITNNINEIEKLNNIINDKGREIEAHKLKYAQLEKIGELSKRNLETDVNIQHEIHVNELNYQFSQERSQLEGFINKLRSKIAEFENKLVLSYIETDRLRLVQTEKDVELELVKEKLYEIELEHIKEIKNLRIQFENDIEIKLVNLIFFVYFI